MKSTDWDRMSELWQASAPSEWNDLERRVRASTLRMKILTVGDVLAGIFGVGAGGWFLFSSRGALWTVIGIYLIALALVATAASIWLRVTAWNERGERVSEHLDLLIQRAKVGMRLAKLGHAITVGMAVYTGLVLYEIVSREGRLDVRLVLVAAAILGAAFAIGAFVERRHRRELLRLERTKKELDT